jgi:hypothetical protein
MIYWPKLDANKLHNKILLCLTENQYTQGAKKMYKHFKEKTVLKL